jgi:hypothetical protein
MGGFRTIYNITKKAHVVIDDKAQVIMVYKDLLMKGEWELSDVVVESTDSSEIFGNDIDFEVLEETLSKSWKYYGENEGPYNWRNLSQMTIDLFKQVQESNEVKEIIHQCQNQEE